MLMGIGVSSISYIGAVALSVTSSKLKAKDHRERPPVILVPVGYECEQTGDCRRIDRSPLRWPLDSGLRTLAVWTLGPVEHWPHLALVSFGARQHRLWMAREPLDQPLIKPSIR